MYYDTGRNPDKPEKNCPLKTWITSNIDHGNGDLEQGMVKTRAKSSTEGCDGARKEALPATPGNQPEPKVG